jgi:hypothetical protein
MTKALEQNEMILRSDPHSGLGELADKTGGFLIADTNDLKAGFQRVNEEMRFYYMLSYAPTNENYDGRFREITVKVKRPGTSVQWRKGYFAVRSQGPVLAYETPALAIIEKKDRPSAFPMRARAFSFPDPKRPGLASVVVEVPGSAPTYTLDKGKNVYLADFVILARIQKESGESVEKLSQRFLMSVPASQIDQAKQASVLFYREAHLPQGRYTIDAVAYDNPNQKAAVQSTLLDVYPQDGERMQVGSVVVAGRVEQVPKAEINPQHPFQFGEVMIFPNLGQPLKKSVQPQLAFMLTAQVPAGSRPPTATAEIWQGAQRLKQAMGAMPAPDAQGRIQYVGSLPLGTLNPGEYELRVRAADGKTSETRSALFTVEE